MEYNATMDKRCNISLSPLTAWVGLDFMWKNKNLVFNHHSPYYCLVNVRLSDYQKPQVHLIHQWYYLTSPKVLFNPPKVPEKSYLLPISNWWDWPQSFRITFSPVDCMYFLRSKSCHIKQYCFKRSWNKVHVRKTCIIIYF